MAISNVTTPSNPALVGNPAYLEVSSNNKILTAGNKAELAWSTYFGLSAGKWVELRWSGNTYRFDVVTPPVDDSGFQLPEFGTPPEMADFIAAFQGNFYINQDFEVILDNDAGPFKWHLIARENGTIYNAVVVNTNGWGGGAPVAGNDDVYAAFFKCLADLWVYIDGAWVQKAMLEGGFDNDVKTKIYFDKILKEQFTIPLPASYFAAVAIDEWIRPMPEMMMEYYLAVREFYGEPPTVKAPTYWGTASAPKQVVAFGHLKNAIVGNTWVNDYYTITAGRKMITDLRGKTILKNQTFYFYAFLKNGYIGDLINLKVDLYFKNGTSSLAIVLSTHTASGDFPAQFWEMSVDWKRIQTLAYYVDDVMHFDLYLTANMTTFFSTEKLRIYVDNLDYEHEHYFLYKHLGGGYATIGFTGFLRKNANYQSKEEMVILGDNYTSEDAEIITFDHHHDFEYALNTGTFEKWKIEQMVQFASSPEVYYLDENFGSATAKWRRVIVDPGGFNNLENQKEDIIERSFTYKNAISEK